MEILYKKKMAHREKWRIDGARKWRFQNRMKTQKWRQRRVFEFFA